MEIFQFYFTHISLSHLILNWNENDKSTEKKKKKKRVTPDHKITRIDAFFFLLPTHRSLN